MIVATKRTHMAKNISFLTLLLMFCFNSFGQHLGMTFQTAEKQGITIQHLDSIYKSALHADTSQAVFKTDSEQVNLQKAYIKLLQDFGKFLSYNNFKWDKPTKCFNRIYFNADGTIDYFLYNFLGKQEDKLSEERQKEFNELLNQFIKEYRFTMTAKVKFSQCSPTTYMSKK